MTTPPIPTPPLQSQMSASPSPMIDAQVALPSKQIIVIFDKTTSMQPYAFDLCQNHLLPMLASFAEGHQTIDAALILFGDSSQYSEYTVKCSHFMRDFREFRSCFHANATANPFVEEGYSSGGYGSSSGIPIVEALCAAHRMTRVNLSSGRCKERHVLLVTNSIPSDAPCRSCPNLGNCHAHVARMAKEGILLSIVAPQAIESLKEIQKLFDSSKPDEDVPVNTFQNPYSLLRGLVITPSGANSNPAAIHPPMAPSPPAPMDLKPVSPALPIASPANPTSNGPMPTPLWEGTLTWQQNVSTPSSPFCELAAYPSTIRPELDHSVYGANDWPKQLTVSGVCNSKDQHITMHFKSAKVVEFLPLNRMGVVKGEQHYKTFYMQLLQKNWVNFKLKSS
eukprot:TRINITY_DN1349_c1_g1_i1.p1 TRINITY_DN1349_c1_g1~~TRINITY_DN1349_c1_g1_i1.p1  ORF type:complete len:394 (-),score=71.66 TRINITY_DN1349_c1_g1_i1:123-1304(-)